MDEIRRRLDAVANVNWSKVKRRKDEEYYSDWVFVGPVMLNDFDPEDEHPQFREQVRAEKREQEAVIEFLTHAADDIRQLLDEHERVKQLKKIDEL